MRILVDINHPAHVHFFRKPVALLAEMGHEVMLTSRDKEMAVPLLDSLDIKHVILSAQKKGGGIWALGRELISRDIALDAVARTFRPDAMAAIGGTFIAHVGWLRRIPSLVFYDTENATLQNAITYPFARQVIVPRCYQGWTPANSARYAGYHELSYLHPRRFEASKEIAEASGLDPARDNFFIRTVSWDANHDIGERGWSRGILTRVTAHLSELGRVHISSESELPPELAKFGYRGRVADVHHLMAACRLYVGESATMASECAVLGVPAVYAAKTGRGYTDEQEIRYGLVKNLREFDWNGLRASIDAMLAIPRSQWREKRQMLLGDVIDVAPFVVETILKSAHV